MANRAGRLSGARHNRIMAEALQRSLDRQRMLQEEMMASGYPAGSKPQPNEYQQYLDLVAAANAGDPRYWQSRMAQARLAELARQYGQPQPLPNPAGVTPPLNPAASAPLESGPPPAQVL